MSEKITSSSNKSDSVASPGKTELSGSESQKSVSGNFKISKSLSLRDGMNISTKAEAVVSSKQSASFSEVLLYLIVASNFVIIVIFLFSILKDNCYLNIYFVVVITWSP